MKMVKEGNYFTGPAKFLVIIFGSGFAFLREICKISTAFQLPCNSHNSVSIERLPFVGANRSDEGLKHWKHQLPNLFTVANSHYQPS